MKSPALPPRLAILSLAAALGGLLHTLPAEATTPAAAGPARGREPVREARCAGPVQAAKASTAGDPAARSAAQKGLTWLAGSAVAWQEQHQCFGCHVQAVTLEAFTVGFHHQYDVDKKAMDAIVGGMLHLNGGARHMNGFSHQGHGILEPSKAFGGAAFAHYDRDVDETVRKDIRKDLLHTAKQLAELQQEDGAVRSSWVNGPVGIGEIQYTYQAMQTWRQAYARTADDVWLAPLRKAEAYLQQKARGFEKATPTETQELSYAILGLLEAGAGQKERGLETLRGELLERQNSDGGWAFQAKSASNAFATGQALYALRQAGMTDGDRAVKKGTAWLIGQQKQDGSWGAGGSGKAEAMWALLGLVSIDVLSIEVSGIGDGTLLQRPQTLTARAADNSTSAGRGVSRMSVFVDDVLVASTCGASITHAVTPDGLPSGLHLVDVVAENAEGKVSRRRLALYTGDHYLTEMGSRYQDGGTLLSARNLGDDDQGHVELSLYEMKQGRARGERVYTKTLGGKKGPLQLYWNGKDLAGKDRDAGRYEAELTYVKAGKPVQTVTHLFTHDTPEAQRERFAEVEGKLNFGGGRAAANAEVELVDEKGAVVQRVWSTRSGQYRFKNVDSGKYKVRLKKEGFKDVEMDLDAEAGAPAAEASAELVAE